VHNEGGAKRVVVTKNLPGERWLKVLTAADCRVEVCTLEDTILDVATIKKLIGSKCHGVIGQLTEVGASARSSPALSRSLALPTCLLVVASTSAHSLSGKRAWAHM
jgi:hypothetical protein